MVVLGSQGTSIENKRFFGSRVRKFAKMTFLGAGFIRFAHPAGCFALLNIAYTSFRPNRWLHSHTTCTNKKSPDKRDFFYWSEGWDLNPRPLRPERSALPG